MEKVQLSFNCRTAGDRVIERSTLVNIRTDTVNEAVNLYQELLENLDKGSVVSEHEQLPQISSQSPTWVQGRTDDDENHDKCPRCNAGLILRTARKGSRAGEQFWSCLAFGSKGCLYTKPA